MILCLMFWGSDGRRPDVWVEVLWKKYDLLLGLLWYNMCFASFPLQTESDPPASARLIDPHPLPDDRALSSVASAHCALAMFAAVWSGLVAGWLIFGHYKFVTFVTGTVHRD